MSGLLQHLKVSTIPDGPDPGQINPSDWNASHVFSGGAGGALLVRDTGDPTYGASWLAAVAAGQVLIANGVGNPPSWTASPVLAGVLTVNGFGTHAFTAAGTGGNDLRIRNTAAGVGNYASLNIETDLTNQLLLQAYSSTYGSSGPYLAGGSVIYVAGAGGLSIVASDPAGAIRFYTGGSTERMRIKPTGELRIGADVGIGNQFTVFDVGGGRFDIGAPGTALRTVAAFYNTNGQVGTISTSGTATAYNTTSDERLKRDLGIAEDLTALGAVVVHDFAWAQDGTRSRGVFAQETEPVFPRAITVGSDGADLSRPWMADYSSFVPDLIVGWQQHEALLHALTAKLIVLEHRL
jgi:hypothetical protein